MDPASSQNFRLGTSQDNHHVFLNIQMKHGGADEDRTRDLLHAMQALSQLSYSPKLQHIKKRLGSPGFTLIQIKARATPKLPLNISFAYGLVNMLSRRWTSQSGSVITNLNLHIAFIVRYLL